MASTRTPSSVRSFHASRRKVSLVKPKAMQVTPFSFSGPISWVDLIGTMRRRTGRYLRRPFGGDPPPRLGRSTPFRLRNPEIGTTMGRPLMTPTPARHSGSCSSS